jgi:hypothetical protein
MLLVVGKWTGCWLFDFGCISVLILRPQASKNKSLSVFYAYVRVSAKLRFA